MAFTFFFRDRHTLDQLINQMLPQTQGFDKLKIWDAGCAMGQEPYTLAILLSEALGKVGFKRVHIDASDIDDTSNFQEIVESGIYNKVDLTRLPENIFENYFVPTDNPSKYRIKDEIRNCLVYKKHDLLTLKPFDRNYNAIICKNVLLHFQPAERVDVINMYYDVLVPGGFLVTEQTQPMPDECKDKWKKTVSDANVWQKI